MIGLGLLALLPLVFVGLASEIFWRVGTLRGEGGRKFIHITSGIWISLWPLFLTMNTIVVLAAGLLLGLVVSRNLHIFHAVYDVKRRTYGEYFYPLAIILCALLAEANWHFAVAVLLLAVADGLAAVAGTRYGKKAHEYRVWGQKKSVLGTCTYFVCAVVIFLAVGRIYADQLNLMVILAMSAGAALLENIFPAGSDNLIIPLLAVLALPAII